MDVLQKFKDTIRSIPDFPKEGILFRDITPVLGNPELCKGIINLLADQWLDKDVDAIAGIESRGFLFGMGLAAQMNVPFVPLRKKGKLPGETFETEYQLEYGTACLELQKDAIPSRSKVLIHDDLLATGGTALAAADLIKQSGCDIAGFSFLIELAFFQALPKLEETAPARRLISY